MKKALFNLLMIAVTATVFTGCKKEDDDNNNTSIIGKWELQEIKYIDTEEDYGDEEEETFYYIFKENNVFQMASDNGVIGTGTYSVSSDGETVTYGGGEGTTQATIKSLTATSLVLYSESSETSQEVDEHGTPGTIVTVTVKTEMTFKRVN